MHFGSNSHALWIELAWTLGWLAWTSGRTRMDFELARMNFGSHSHGLWVGSHATVRAVAPREGGAD